jgi:hypothetical protein
MVLPNGAKWIGLVKLGWCTYVADSSATRICIILGRAHGALASGVWHAATIINASGMRAQLPVKPACSAMTLFVQYLHGVCNTAVSLCRMLSICCVCRVGHGDQRCPATMPDWGLCDFNNNYVEAFEPGNLDYPQLPRWPCRLWTVQYEKIFCRLHAIPQDLQPVCEFGLD